MFAGRCVHRMSNNDAGSHTLISILDDTTPRQIFVTLVAHTDFDIRRYDLSTNIRNSCYRLEHQVRSVTWERNECYIFRTMNSGLNIKWTPLEVLLGSTEKFQLSVHESELRAQSISFLCVCLHAFNLLNFHLALHLVLGAVVKM
jgi:hypothetical protein